MKRMKLERAVVAELHEHGRSVAILVNEFKIIASAPALNAKRDCWSCVHRWCTPVRDGTVVSVDSSSFKMCQLRLQSCYIFMVAHTCCCRRAAHNVSVGGTVWK